MRLFATGRPPWMKGLSSRRVLERVGLAFAR